MNELKVPRPVCVSNLLLFYLGPTLNRAFSPFPDKRACNNEER
jgi:hypothetical protein